MDKKLLIDSYLEGKHPIEQEKWELPTESELDRDEALYDALLAERLSKSPLKGDFTSPLRGGRVGSWRGRRRLFGSIAAVLIAAIALFTWWNFKPQQPTQLAETTTKPLVKEVPPSEPPTAQPALNNQITQNNQISQSPQKTPITQKTPNTPSNQKTPTTPKAPQRLRLLKPPLPTSLCLPLPPTASTTISPCSRTRWATAETAPAWLS